MADISFYVCRVDQQACFRSAFSSLLHAAEAHTSPRLTRHKSYLRGWLRIREQWLVGVVLCAYSRVYCTRTLESAMLQMRHLTVLLPQHEKPRSHVWRTSRHSPRMARRQLLRLWHASYSFYFCVAQRQIHFTPSVLCTKCCAPQQLVSHL